MVREPASMSTNTGMPRPYRIAVVVADSRMRAHETDSDGVPVGFVDDTPNLLGTAVLGLEVLAPIASLGDIAHDAVVVAVGDNHARRAITERLLAAGERLASAIHPRACVAPSATIGEGSMISAGATVTPRAVLGRGVTVDRKSTRLNSSH